MKDSFFPEALTLTRTLKPGALPSGTAAAARAFVAKLLRPAPRVQASGPVTLLMAAESVAHKRAIVRQVIRWHNRHPLARRLTPADINGFGTAMLPFSAPQADGKRYALFDDASLLPGISTRRLAQFALTHGHIERPGARHWARRVVPVAAGWNPNQAQPLHLQVAALKGGVGRKSRRLLLGQPAAPGLAWPVLGQRMWSTPRVAVAGLLAALPLVGAGMLLAPLLQRLPTPAMPTMPALPTLMASAEPAPVVAAPTAQPAPALAPQATQQTPSEPAPAPAPLPGAPVAGLPLEHATDPLRLGAGRYAGQRNGPPVRLALIGSIGSDAPEQIAFQANLRAALPLLGNQTARLSVDVVGTPDGDAVTLWPFDDEAAAQRVGQALRARGIMMRVAEL